MPEANGSGDRFLRVRIADRFGTGLADVELHVVRANVNYWRQQTRLEVAPIGRPQGPDRGIARLRTDGLGYASVEGLAAGTYQVYAKTDRKAGGVKLNAIPLALGRPAPTLTLDSVRFLLQVRLPSGELAPFRPRVPATKPGDDGAWAVMGTELRVTITPRGKPNEDGAVYSPGFGLAASQPPVDRKVEWFATGTEERWQVRLPPGTPYVIQVAGPNRSPVFVDVTVKPMDPLRTVEIPLGPKVEPGVLDLAIVDPAGTDSVQGYGVTVLAHGGSHWGAATVRRTPRYRAERGPDERLRLLLPPGTYRLHVRPAHETEGQFCYLNTSGQVEPGPVAQLVSVAPGPNSPLTIRTAPQAAILVRRPEDESAWTARIVDPGSGRVLESQQVRARVSHALFQVPAGTYRVEAELHGQALIPWTGRVAHAEILALQQASGGLVRWDR